MTTKTGSRESTNLDGYLITHSMALSLPHERATMVIKETHILIYFIQVAFWMLGFSVYDYLHSIICGI